MAFSAVTLRGSNVSNTNTTTVAVSPTAAITVGKIAFAVCGSDNDATTDSDTTFHTVTDSVGNTWARLKERTETDGAANDGATASVWWTKVTTEIGTGASVTLTLGVSETDKVIVIFEATVGAGKSIALAQAGTGNNAIEAAVSGMTSREYLLIGWGVAEGEDTAKTPDADYTELYDGQTSASGLPDVNISAHLQTRIATLTGDTVTSTAWTNTNAVTILAAVYESSEPIIMAADTVSFSDTFNPATFNRTMVAGSGSFNDTGNDAGLAKGKVMVAATASFALTGNSWKSLLLDYYPTAKVAYSLRRLSTTYTGSAVRVRRSNDDTEQDIGFTNNALNLTALSTFVGSNSAYITKWYDQSGNGTDAVNATNSAQPLLVSSGTLQTYNGLPTVYFDGTDNQLATTAFTQHDGNFLALGILALEDYTGAARQALCGDWIVNNPRYLLVTNFAVNGRLNGAAWDASDNFYSPADNSYVLPLNTLSLVTLQKDTSNLTHYKNKSQQGQAAMAVNAKSTSHVLTVGNYNINESEYWKGPISELILYGFDNSANRSSIEGDLFNYYISRIEAGTRSHTLTGNAATFNRTMVAASGSFNDTGNAATFNRSIVAATTSYALTGNDATLTHTPAAKVLEADTQSYALTGNAVGVNRTMVAATSSFAVTGNDATFPVSKVLAADTVAYAVTGNTATFNRTALCSTQSYAVTGNAAEFKKGYTLVAATGSYAVTLRSVGINYYVDFTSGSDSNNGKSTGAPWKTINKVNTSTFTSGDTISFKRGETWREQLSVPSSGSSTGDITFNAYGTGADPIITGSDLGSSGWTNHATNVWKKTITTEPKIVYFDNTRGIPETAIGNISAAYEWYWTANTLYVYSTSDPATAYTAPGVEYGQRNHAFFTDNKEYLTIDGITLRDGNNFSTLLGVLTLGYSVADNITVSNCVIERGAGLGIYMQGPFGFSNILISGCTIQNNGAIAIGNTDPLDSGTGRITNCLITTNGLSAQSGDMTPGGIQGPLAGFEIDNNIITNQTPDPYAYSDILFHGIYNSPASVTPVVIHDNLIYSNTNGTGIKCQGSGTIYNNVIHSNQLQSISAGWDFSVNITLDVYKNTFYGGISEYGHVALWNNYGTHTLTANIYNNTFYKGNGAYSNTGLVGAGTDIKGNITMKNNIFYSKSSCAAHNWPTQTGTLDFDYNIYWQDAQSGQPNIEYNGTTYGTLASWQSFSGQDANSINADPLLVSPTSDLTLQSTSPARDAGVNVGLSYLGTAPDMGAYEFEHILVAATRSHTLTGSAALLNRSMVAGSGSFALTGNDATLTYTSAKTLNADTSSFTLTGNAATINRTMVAGSGSFALTGNDILTNRSIIAATTSYAVTGNDTGLQQGYVLSCDAGAYTLTGIDNNLQAGKQITCVSAAFVLTGNAVTLPRTYILTAAPTSFAVTGNTAGFDYNQIMSVNTGTYNLTGNDADLVYTPVGSYSMIADSGAFTLTGNAATVNRSTLVGTTSYTVTGNAATVNRTMVAGSGTFTTTGNDGALQRTYALQAEVQNYTVTGTDISVQRTYRIEAGNGNYALVGYDADLSTVISYTLNADGASFTFTGNATEFLVNRQLAADTGEFTIYGTVTELSRSYLIQCSLGAFVLTGNDITVAYSSGLLINYWNGSAWIPGRLKAWTGAEWKGKLKRYDGNNWN